MSFYDKAIQEIDEVEAILQDWLAISEEDPDVAEIDVADVRALARAIAQRNAFKDE